VERFLYLAVGSPRNFSLTAPSASEKAEDAA
jgi:hypothetical protein